MLMTAYSFDELVSEALEGGALGVLNKPFTTGEVLDAVESIRGGGLVLVVDDDPDFVESVTALLEGRGYSVCSASNGQAGVQAVLDAEKVDFLILDLHLPMLSGFEVFLELKRLGREIPTIIVTGYASENVENIDSLRSMAHTGCLVKPFAPAELLDALGAFGPNRDSQ